MTLTHMRVCTWARRWGAEHTQALQWELSDADMQSLGAMGVCRRMVDGAVWVGPQSPYRTLRDLWDEDDTSVDPTPQPMAMSAPPSTHRTHPRHHPSRSRRTSKEPSRKVPFVYAT